MKVKKGITGVIADCRTCLLHWESQDDMAHRKAEVHAKLTGHKVTVQETKSIIYNWE